MSVTLREHTKIVGKEFVTFGKNVMIDDFVFISATEEYPVHIGNYVHIASFVTLAGGPVTLEDFCNIGAGSRLIAGSDDFRASLIGPTIPAEFRNVNRAGIIMKRHAVLGANCVVLPGIIMAEGSIAGAGALINHDTAPWRVYVGSPARVIGRRDSQSILALEMQLPT